jgi:SAM-dependent methyltransferase
MQGLVYDVQRYYRAVAPFMAAELANRGDAGLWGAVGRRFRGGRILEIGCGGGRVTALLAEAGADVTGIDLSPELLAEARFRDTRAWLILADVRRLALRARFDAIVAADDPFSHLTSSADRQAALGAVAAHLAPRGVFVLDALWFAHGVAGKTEDRDVVRDGRPVHVTERWRCNRRTHRCSTDYAYQSSAGELTEAHFEARYWTASELAERFARAGLRITHRWGGYDGEPWDERRSERLVVEARPQAGRG